MLNFVQWHEARHKDTPGQKTLWDEPAKKELDMTDEEAYANTPFALFKHDTKAAEAAGWRFERDEQGYHGNMPASYAISPEGLRYKWNQNMRHGGADPWELDYNAFWALKHK